MPTVASAMRTVSLRNLAAHKVRLLLTVVSVLLGVAFVAGSFVFTDTLRGSFQRIVSTSLDGVDSRVQPRHSYDPGVPVALVDRIAALPGVRAVEPEITAPIVLIDSHGNRVRSGGAPTEAGIWTPAGRSIRAVPGFASGRAPAGPGEVAVNEGAAHRGSLHVGDRVTVVTANSGPIAATISGVYRTDIETGGYVGVRFTEAEALRLFTDGDHVSAVNVAARGGTSEQALTARIARLLPSTLEARTGTQVRADATARITTALSFVNYILLAFGFIAMIVGTFIIYNTFSMIVAQRLRELALLRAIGADRRQVRRSVLLEAGVIGVVGSALGLAAGVGLAYGLHALLDALDLGLPSGGLVLSPRTVVVAVAVGTVVTLFSAYAPARRAGRIPPVAAMREEFASASPATLRRRTRLGAAVLVLGGLATGAGTASGSTGSGAALIGLGLVGATVGALLLSPLLADWIITPLGRLVGRPFGAVGRLARTNAVRNPRRTAATAFALTLGLLLVSGIAVIGASFKASVGRLFDTTVRADYVLTTAIPAPVPLPAAQAAARVPGVASVTELHGFTALLDGRQSTGTGVDGPLPPVARVRFEQGGGSPTGSSMLISRGFADSHGWTLGSTHTLSRPGQGAARLTVTGIYGTDQLLGPWLASGDLYRQLTPRTEWSDMVALIKADPGTDLSALRTGLENAVADYYIVDVQDREQVKGQFASQVNGLLGLLYGLLGLAIVIAVLGIVNTLALSVVERRREIGMLRAVGMLRKQVRRALYLESLLIAVFGAVLGLALGLGYGALFTHRLGDQGMDRLSVPWGQALGFLVVAGVVGVLAALWPGIRAARTRPLEAIAEQ